MTISFVLTGVARGELNIMSHLRGHTNTIRLCDSMIREPFGLASVFTEYCHWGSCSDLIDRHSTQPGGALHIRESWLWQAFKQLAAAINYLHTGGGDSSWAPILHLDLKPSNVLLTPGFAGPNIKVADFGSASCIPRGIIGSQTFMGHYAPPERYFYSQGTFTDVWGVGAVMITLCQLKHRIPRAKSVGWKYSGALADAVKWCLYDHHAMRVDSRNLSRLLNGLCAHVNMNTTEGVPPIPPIC
ncbi:kinase-like protein [Pleomassaria siparia CBS 279.74]|uniref:non-specific serine/threonine protein kinase n=1 Tax=Pleomassaria siparia CBS 279.74 TaxID=1314801 RepID=A0A6G1JRZ3_9PLEO|nr:kinase-like protein [Pleomassaria siparia CBS 279.74]